MDLGLRQAGQIGFAADINEDARQRCKQAGELEDSGNYDAARGALGHLWRRIGERPQVSGLEAPVAARVLLRAGALAGWIGSANQIEGAQEWAKNLITESLEAFEAIGDPERAAEALTDLAWCYWREGAHDEARATLSSALERLSGRESEQKAVTLLRSAIVELTATRYHDALNHLDEARPLVERSESDALKGKYYMNLAIVLNNLRTREQREDYTDRALLANAMAARHLELAGHLRYRARVENNLAFIHISLSRFAEAHTHLDRARSIFASLKDAGSIAQVDETRARVFLAEGRNSEAERTSRSARTTLEKGDEQALLAQAEITNGIALARLGRYSESRRTLERAMEIALQAGDNEGAGQAALAMIEESGDGLALDMLAALYSKADELLASSQKPALIDRLRRCARLVIKAPRQSAEFEAPGFVYASDLTERLLRDAHNIARGEAPVLIAGETGTGKELLARLIHHWSGRRGEFVAINCASLTDGLIESQMFGHTKGSFTNAIQDHRGLAREALCGTLFLDEITELSPTNQAKLLRMIEYGEIHTVGAGVPERINIRVIAATNRNLNEMIEKKLFRLDLYYRLQTFHFEIPPLRARTADIPALARYFIDDCLRRSEKRITFPPETIEAMRSLYLRGNARELRSLVERTILTAADGSTIPAEAVETISLRQTQKAGLASPWADFSLKEEVRCFEERFIEMALRDAGGMVSVAARLLGFRHHETLNWRLNNRNKSMQSARKPAVARKRSIIKIGRDGKRKTRA